VKPRPEVTTTSFSHCGEEVVQAGGCQANHCHSLPISSSTTPCLKQQLQQDAGSSSMCICTVHVQSRSVTCETTKWTVKEMKNETNEHKNKIQ
jgi:hypothetical protein